VTSIIQLLTQDCVCQELSKDYDPGLSVSHMISKNHQPTIFPKFHEEWETKWKPIYWLYGKTNAFVQALKFLTPNSSPTICLLWTDNLKIPAHFKCYTIYFIKSVCFVLFFWYWVLNSQPSPWATPPALF
jgi:hypothetical protein